MRAALLAKAMRPPLSYDRRSNDRLGAPEPVEIYGTDGGEVYAWFPYSDIGPVLPPNLPILRVPKVQPLVYRVSPPEPLAVTTKLDDIEPWICSEPAYTVTIRQWAVWMKGKMYRWAVSVYCAFDQTAGDWIVCGEPHTTYEPHYQWDDAMQEQPR